MKKSSKQYLVKRIKEIFEEKISAKTGWGKNEIIKAHNEAVNEAMMEYIEENFEN